MVYAYFHCTHSYTEHLFFSIKKKKGRISHSLLLETWFFFMILHSSYTITVYIYILQHNKNRVQTTGRKVRNKKIREKRYLGVRFVYKKKERETRTFTEISTF